MAGSDRNRRERGMMERMGRGIGGMAGRAADAAADIGGGIIRGAADVLGGWWAGAGAQDAAASWGEAEDRRSRQHFEGSMEASSTGGASARAEGEVDTGSRSASASTYEEVRPFYQLGHAARRNPDYGARDFEEVEPELRRLWDARASAAADTSADASAGRSGSGATPDSAEAEARVDTAGGWPEVRGYVRFGYEQGETTEGEEERQGRE